MIHFAGRIQHRMHLAKAHTKAFSQTINKQVVPHIQKPKISHRLVVTIVDWVVYAVLLSVAGTTIQQVGIEYLIP